MGKIIRGLSLFLPVMICFVNAIDPQLITLLNTVPVILDMVMRWYNTHFNPCGNWIVLNATGLENDMSRKLFGQHIASRVITTAVTGYMYNENLKKPLVLSLHGSTGTGKNFVTQLIAENIYKKGLASEYVHQFVATTHFPHASQKETYKSQLQQWIKGNVTNCPHSLFIFDEMDKMPDGIIDSIKPYLDYYNNLDGVSYRQAIFIFLSNSGGEDITKVVLDFWREGRDREEIQLKDIEDILSEQVFNNKQSGLWHTSLIDKNLVDFFVPFLPVEYRHVRECVLAEMAARNLPRNEMIADQAANDMTYFPKKEKEKVFSVKGCKTIASRLQFYV